MKCLYGISIHSPLRGETIHICANASIPFISIHLLRAEQDHPIWAASSGSKIFQSTCSVRSKTAMRGHLTIVEGISIHLLRAEQDTAALLPATHPKISIHLLRAEQDNGGVLWHASGAHFNPLAPCGARQQRRCPLRAALRISIHLLRAEQDTSWRISLPWLGYFNPLAPCGARPFLPAYNAHGRAFQSTCSVRSKTRNQRVLERGAHISIHLLRAEQDCAPIT